MFSDGDGVVAGKLLPARPFAPFIRERLCWNFGRSVWRMEIKWKFKQARREEGRRTIKFCCRSANAPFISSQMDVKQGMRLSTYPLRFRVVSLRFIIWTSKKVTSPRWLLVNLINAGLCRSYLPSLECIHLHAGMLKTLIVYGTLLHLSLRDSGFEPPRH